MASRTCWGYAFSLFDRVVYIEIHHARELTYAVKLSELRVVRIMCGVSNCDLTMLEQLPRLEALDMCCVSLQNVPAVGETSADRFFHMPTLGRLRGLNLNSTTFNGSGLDNVPQIEMLDLRHTEVGDECVPTILAFRNLKRVMLGGTTSLNLG